MKDEIRVNVVKRKGANLYLRYVDPVTGKRREKNSGTKSQKKAERAAGEWQAELNANGVAADRIVRWSDFRDDFFENHVDHLSDSYGSNVASTFNIIEDTMSPDKLTRVTTAWIKRFKTLMVKQDRPAATVHKYLQHLQTALKWAVDQEYLKTLPKFPAQKRNAAKGKKHMKGRPITLEEFERMLAACVHESLRYLMCGLWLSGLRLGEAMVLTWDQWGDGIRIEIDDDNDVCLLIDGEDQKNAEAVTYPLVDEFAEFLLQTPENEREGFVFNPQCERAQISRRVDTVSDWLSAVGEKAGVKVDMRQDRKTKQQVPVFASAHDFRRAFGERWSQIVPSMMLKELMRHSSVQTTEKYYVGINAKRTIAAIRSLKKATEVNEEVNGGKSRATKSRKKAEKC